MFTMGQTSNYLGRSDVHEQSRFFFKRLSYKFALALDQDNGKKCKSQGAIERGAGDFPDLPVPSHFKASLNYKQGLLYSSPFVFLVQRLTPFTMQCDCQAPSVVMMVHQNNRILIEALPLSPVIKGCCV